MMVLTHRLVVALAGAGAFLASFALAGSIRNSQPQPLVIAGVADGSDVSVLTYNINGLPWPFARGREEAFVQIENRLNAMRIAGNQPHIIVLQEAFTERAKKIGVNAGYRYIVDGPGSGALIVDAGPTQARSFASGASFTKGEALGKWMNSGLVIVTDYPVLSIQRAPFPSFACAGYDCLANKGALLVTVRVPGQAEPVTIVTTHMNSKRASGVSEERSAKAYRMQAEALERFVRNNHDPAAPIIIGGDFNASNLDRRQILAGEAIAPLSVGWENPVRSGLAEIAAGIRTWPPQLKSEVDTIATRGRDWQFIASGTRVKIAPLAVSVPFGKEADGTMLSDHMGMMISYRLDPKG